jgi:hypothetical protein
MDRMMFEQYNKTNRDPAVTAKVAPAIYAFLQDETKLETVE